ncbi:MAG: NTP transferase domain-containing protein [Thermoplasmatales archaeon]
MKAVIFVKQSERLPGKHLMTICGEPIIKRIYDTLERTSLFEDVVIYSKYPDLEVGGCKIEQDNTVGTLLDSILSAIVIFGEFLAVGGDLPLLDSEIISKIVLNYHGNPVAAVDYEGIVEPLLAIYNKLVYEELLKFSMQSKKIFEFVGKQFELIELDEASSSKLLNVNTLKDLNNARRLIHCIQS